MACLCCTAATQNMIYGNSPAVPTKSSDSSHVLQRPGWREDLADGSIQLWPDVVG